MTRLIYDYSKLLGKIREKGFTQASLGKGIGLSEGSVNAKLGNKIAFKQDEIVAICNKLDISLDNIEPYFFTCKLSKMKE